MTNHQKVALDESERETLAAFEKALQKGKIKSVPNVKSEIKKMKMSAKLSANKTKRVSLRMTEWDFNKAQERALQEGLPYQTLLSSIIHKYLSGQLSARQ